MSRYYRKVIRIVAEDSPNVKYAIWQQTQGIEPTNEIVVPGVLTWDEYCKRRDMYDEITKSVSLWAQFYEGPELKLFPPQWLARAAQYATEIYGKRRTAVAIGVDPAEGGDKTSMAAVDELGLIELVSRKTPNTDVVPREALAFARKHNVKAENVCFDAGGGGKQHADRLRAMGFDVRAVRFGETLILEPKRGLRQLEERLDNKEEKYAYVSRRVQMYWELSLACDPTNARPFALSRVGEACQELHFQLSKFPRQYDPEGRCKLPPKNKKTPDSKEITLVDMIGHSPDEADAVVLACHGMWHAKKVSQAGGF